MTVDEFAKLAAAIKTYYPRDNLLPTDEGIELWYDALKDLDYTQAEQGLRKYAMTNKFAPGISDIRDCTSGFTKPRELNDMEAWFLVRKAIGNGIYGAEEEFSKLPDVIQEAVGHPRNLRDWATMESGMVDSVVQANFLKNYRVVIQRKEEMDKIPDKIRQTIENMNVGVGIEVKPYVKIEKKEEHNGIPMPEELENKIKEYRDGGNDDE